MDSFPDLVDLLAAEKLTSQKHTLERATYHGLGDRPAALAVLDWSQAADKLAALVRALDFGAYANPLALPKIVANGEIVLAGSLAELTSSEVKAGTVVGVESDVLRIAAKGGTLSLTRLMSVDGAPLDAIAALAKLKAKVGDVLPAPQAGLTSALEWRF